MESIQRIANQKAHEHVSRREPFKGSNLYAEYRTVKQDSFREAIREALGEPLEVYAVFSYGEHFPIYAFRAGQWFRNKDKYSVTTSKHQSQARPWDVSHFTDLDTDGIKAVCGL